MMRFQFWGMLILLLVVSACSPVTDSMATSTSVPIPAPGIQFSVDRSYIKVGMCVVFTWHVENSKAVYFYAEGELGEDKVVLPRDSREECRKESTWYYLRVIGFDDAVEIREIHIPVESLPGL